jgi:class 3 adenylate cyclase/tetratricopeptide (TPR) repeat protein
VTRSIVVVLLVDTVNSTAMLSHLGQERMDALTALEMDALRDAIAANGGEVVKSLGDGLLAIFPAASSALDAAAAIHRAVGRLNDGNRFGVDVRVRVAIAASDAVVEAGEIRGIAPVLTARLEKHGGSGETLCTDTVRALAQGWGDHGFERLEPLHLRGIPEPVVVHRVTAPIAEVLGMPETLDATRRFEFVGRARESEALTAAWEAAQTGAGSFVVVAGDPGVGKTRLCREFARTARHSGAIVLHGYCTEISSWAFEPFVQPLRHCLARVADPTGLLGNQPAELARIVPEIKTRLPDLAVAASADVDTARHRLFEAVSSWLGELSQHAPVLFILDDLSWADEASITLLRHLVRGVSAQRVLVVASYRPSDASEHARRFLRDEAASGRRVELSGLDQDQALVFAETVLGGPLDRNGRDVVTTAARTVGGNPLYLGEVVTHLSESAGLVRAATNVWTAGPGLQEHIVPASVRDVIRVRIDRLGTAAQRVLRIASVVGTAVAPSLLLELLESNPAECLAAVDDAVEAGFLRAAGDDRFEFTHSIFRDVVYGGLSELRRTAEHLRVGETIERLYAADLGPWLEVLAHQFERCVQITDRSRAIGYLRRAGRQAEASLGHDHAAAFYRRALQIAVSSPTVDDRLCCELLIEVGDAERRSGQKEARQTLLEATRRAIALGDGDLATRAVIGSGRGVFSRAGSLDVERVDALRDVLELLGPDRPGNRARILAALSAELIFDDDAEAAEVASDEALAIARESSDPTTLVTTLGLRLVALWRPDRLKERLRIGAELDGFRQLAGIRSGQFLSAMTLYCQAAMEAGDLELADRLLGWIEQTAQDLRQPTTVGYAKLRVASRACIDGRLDEAEELATEAYHLCLDGGQTDAEAFYTGQLFTIRLHQGRLDEVVELVERSASRYPGIKAFRAAVATCAAEVDDLDRCRHALDEVADGLEEIRFDLNWLPAIAIAAVATARLADADLASRLRPLLEPYHDQFVDNASTFFGSVDHFAALCSAVLGDDDAADESFERAILAHQRLASPPLLARTQLEYATALSRRGHRRDEEAVELATAALAEAERRGFRTIRVRGTELLSRLRPTVEGV